MNSPTNWQPDQPTTKQRRALYRFSIPRKLVKAMNYSQASRLLNTLSEVIEKRGLSVNSTEV